MNGVDKKITQSTTIIYRWDEHARLVQKTLDKEKWVLNGK
jgi:hypothetical protein